MHISIFICNRLVIYLNVDTGIEITVKTDENWKESVNRLCNRPEKNRQVFLHTCSVCKIKFLFSFSIIHRRPSPEKTIAVTFYDNSDEN